MLLVLSIHTHTVKCNGLDDLGAHNFDGTVGWQLKVEEASISFGQQLVLVQSLLPLVLLRSRFDHKSHVLTNKGLVVGGDSFLAPAEFNELLSLVLSELSEE